MKLEDAKDKSNAIYDAFKDEVCEDCKSKIEERLSSFSKFQMAMLVANPKNIHKKLGICKKCIRKIYKKLLKNQKNGN